MFSFFNFNAGIGEQKNLRLLVSFKKVPFDLVVITTTLRITFFESKCIVFYGSFKKVTDIDTDDGDTQNSV